MRLGRRERRCVCVSGEQDGGESKNAGELGWAGAWPDLEGEGCRLIYSRVCVS